MDTERDSGLGKDLLGSGLGNPVDGSGANQPPVVHDLVFGSSRRHPTRAVGGDPVDSESGPPDPALTMNDRTRDDPLDHDVGGTVGGGDGDAPGVLGPVGIDPVDDVGADYARPLVQIGTGDAGDAQGHHRGEDQRPGHDVESTGGMRPILKWLIGIGAVILAGVMAFAIFEPVQVLPRIRVAPGFALTDQSGSALTSEDGRGAVTLYTFLPTDCGDECGPVHDTLREVAGRVTSSVDLAGSDFREVTVALDTSDPAELQAAAEAAGADGDLWRWAGAEPDTLRDVVGDGFRVFYEETETGVEFDPVFVIVDGTGLVRGDYRYSAIASDADRLSNHIAILGEELRNSKGAASLVYEAAHVFLCYP